MKARIALGFILSMYGLVAFATAGLSVFEELLYWHASETTSSLWVTVQPVNNPPAYTYPVPNVNFNWRPGLKLGLQYDPVQAPDFKLYWTYFSTKARESATAPPNHVLIPVFFSGFTTLNPFSTAQLNWQIRMNMIDAEIGHEFPLFDGLSIRPFIGVKGGAINQNIYTNWQASIGGFNLYTASENVVNNFSGVGPSFGVDGHWNLYNHLRFNSSLSTAFLWGRWKILDTYTRPEALFGLISPTSISSSSNNSMLGAFMARLFLGLEWNFTARTLVSIKLGYEMQFWANQLRLPLYEQLPVRGDLTLQGLSCGILVDL